MYQIETFIWSNIPCQILYKKHNFKTNLSSNYSIFWQKVVNIKMKGMEEYAV